ncbi:MAG: Eco57I restriction-modification methylase domain-containing protein [Ktedonobacteraceae bacterium]
MSEQSKQQGDVNNPLRIIELRETVRQHLEALTSEQNINPLKDLFWSVFEYDRVNSPLSRTNWRDRKAVDFLADDPVLLASGGANRDFPVYYARLNNHRLLAGHERAIVKEMFAANYQNGLFVFSNSSQDTWHFVNVKDDTRTSRRQLFRRITVGSQERLRTATERLTLLNLADVPHASRPEIVDRHDHAFDVGIVTQKFFDEYKTVFNILQADLKAQGGDASWAHDYALQFLNRCMFLYFVQRKGWLGDDTHFLLNFWYSYHKTPHEGDTFFKQWLQVLFFEAFNKGYRGTHPYFPAHIHRILSEAPYLNGGLFARNELDTIADSFNFSDFRFNQVLDFLERYNFTIAEDSPLDQEVAVDPEMIGHVYESLVNVSTEVDEKGDAGIFYTPRAEIDLMCRLALVDYLANHIGADKKNILYDVVFALEPHEQSEADDRARVEGIWQKIGDCLQHPRILDPACGSGAFLVGMLYVLDNLNARVHENRYLDENPYKRKKRIIEECLYGVDVMGWAVQVAELRLWLSLIIDADLTLEERIKREDPLLPHLSFKVRIGDSLVQEVGDINMGHKQALSDLSQPFRVRMNTLITDKRTYFHNHSDRNPRTKEDIEQEELQFFRDILDERIHTLDEDIQKHSRTIETQKSPEGIFGDKSAQAKERDSIIREQQQLISEKERQLQSYREAREKLKTPKDVPFVWDVAFYEVCGSGNNGFDIVIGNPPYVRQERIAAPVIASYQSPGSYKSKLAHSIYRAFPDYFGYTAGGRVRRKIDARSDLYVYFYLLGLSLLNEKGSFCFITSNSWLDVGYGAGLQEFLLTNCRVKLILDNQLTRSFASADVNTIIALFSAPARETGANELDNIARFVMLKVRFDQALEADLFKAIEQAQERKNDELDRYRVFPISQQALLEDGNRIVVEAEEAPTSRRGRTGAASALIKEPQAVYGNKLGGKYLRAPDIYWTILEKGHDKLVRLGDIAEVRFGIKTGANEFFYLDTAKILQWKIEDEFLQPVIKSPKECKSILIDPSTLKSRLFVCHKSKAELKGTHALAYIEWGEQQAFRKNPSVAGRAKWWDVGVRHEPKLGFNYLIDSTARTLYAPDGCYFSDNFQEIGIAEQHMLPLCVSLNSTVFQLMVNVAGRANFGDGLLKIQTYEVSDLLCVDPTTIHFTNQHLFSSASWDVLLPSNARRNLDQPVFDALHLTQGERKAVYEEVANLVHLRLDKANSLKETRERNKRMRGVDNTLGIWIGLPDEAIESMEEVEGYYA